MLPNHYRIRIKKLLSELYDDSLFRNSFYLILATAVMAGFGFFFWLISARMVSPENIGLATALISAMNIIAIFSLIGFDSAIVRFLSHSTPQERNDKLNTGIILVGTAALVLGVIFIIFVRNISPSLSFIQQNILTSFAFVVFCVMSAINILTDAVFLAYRQTKFSFIINTIFSFIKMLLPLAFAPWGAFGIFTAAAVGQSVGFVLSIGVMIWKFNYRPEFIINRDVLKEVRAYCTGNYVAGALNLLPVTLLPIVITNRLGAKEAAYFYIVMMIGNLLYVIPQSATKSLFAEGSHDEKTIAANIKKSLKVVALLLFPAIILLLIGGKYILGFFGKSYSTDGIQFLYLIAISGIAVSAYSVFNTIFRVQKKLTRLLVVNLFYAGTIIGLAYLFLPLGLGGVGFAWLLGNAIAGIIGWTLYRFSSSFMKKFYR